MTADGLRLNLGCGLQAPAGWANLDRSPNLLLDRVHPLKRVLRGLGILSEAHMASWPRNIVLHDLRKPLPYEDGSAEAVYSSHTLEHLYLDEAAAVLRDVQRVLRPDGVVRLALPDAEAMAREFLAASDDAEAARRFTWELNAGPLEAPSRRARAMAPLASGFHRWQPTWSLVRSMLEEAGFADVRRCGFLQGDCPDLASVEHRDGSLFVEATRPAS